MKRLKNDLYRAYELVSSPVMSHPNLSDLPSTPCDRYEMLLNARTLLNHVEALPKHLAHVVQAKYGRQDKSLLIALVQQEFNLPYQAAQLFVSVWLDEPTGELQSLREVLSCSKSTITRRYKAVHYFLEDLELQSLRFIIPKYLEYVM